MEDLSAAEAVVGDLTTLLSDAARAAPCKRAPLSCTWFASMASWPHETATLGLGLLQAHGRGHLGL